MSGRKIHYEIFVRQVGPSGSWRLVDAMGDKETAQKRAKALLDAGGLRGVKVVKETYNQETGDYLSLTVCELGDTLDPKKPDGTDAATLPCFRPQDLYTSHSRATIARLLTDFLGRQRLTVTELIHRADALEKLNATGTILQHAIQKVAVAHAGATGESVQDAVRKLNDLVSKASERVYKDARAQAFPQLGAGGLNEAYQAVATAPEPDYLLCSAVAHYLKGYKDWGDKLQAVLKLMDTLPSEEAWRDTCLDIIDRFVCDMVAGRAALQDLMGPQPSFGALLTQMTYLFLGKIGPVEGEDPPEMTQFIHGELGSHLAKIAKTDIVITPGVRALSREFVHGKLGGARAAIGQRILAELRAPRRLEPDCLETEVRVVRRLAGQMVLGQGKYLPLEDITDAFTARSRRLMAADAIDPYVEALADPHERIAKLIALEGNVVGAENKRTLATILLPQITAHATEKHYLGLTNSPVSRLKEIAQLQGKILAADFPDANKRQLAEALDTLACSVEAHVGMIEGLCRRQVSTEDKIMTLLRLATGAVFTEGELERRAKVATLRLIRQPSFSLKLSDADKKDPKAVERLREICELIDRAELHKISAAA